MTTDIASSGGKFDLETGLYPVNGYLGQPSVEKIAGGFRFGAEGADWGESRESCFGMESADLHLIESKYSQ